MHRWAHAETRNPTHDIVSPLWEADVPWWNRVGAELKATAGAKGAVPKPMGWDDGRAHLYGLLWDREYGPRMGGVPRQLPSIRRAARGSGCWGMWGWWSIVSGTSCGPFPGSSRERRSVRHDFRSTPR